MSSPPTDSDLSDEYATLLGEGGFVRLKDYTLLSLTGEDRRRWLNNFCTNDVVWLDVGQGCEAFILNVKGRTLGLAIVLHFESALQLLMIGQSRESIADHLNKYIIREDVLISDQTSSHGLCLAAGNAAQIVLEKYLGADPKPFTHRAVQDECPAQAVATSMISHQDLLLLAETNDDERLTHWLEENGMRECSIESFEIARIAHGTPLNGRDITSDNFPQEFRRDDLAISFDKGCYLGQETVARIDAMGHVNRFLVKVQFDALVDTSTGLEFRADDKKIGVLTSCIKSPAHQRTIGLAFVRTSKASAGQQLESDLGPATVVDEDIG